MHFKGAMSGICGWGESVQGLFQPVHQLRLGMICNKGGLHLQLISGIWHPKNKMEPTFQNFEEIQKCYQHNDHIHMLKAHHSRGCLLFLISMFPKHQTESNQLPVSSPTYTIQCKLVLHARISNPFYSFNFLQRYEIGCWKWYPPYQCIDTLGPKDS